MPSSARSTPARKRKTVGDYAGFGRKKSKLQNLRKALESEDEPEDDPKQTETPTPAPKTTAMKFPRKPKADPKKPTSAPRNAETASGNVETPSKTIIDLTKTEKASVVPSPRRSTRLRKPDQDRRGKGAAEDGEESLATLAIEETQGHPSVLNLPNTLYESSLCGPLASGLPVGTYRPDDASADPGSDFETKMRYRRVICVNFDSDGKIRWNPIELNIYGEVPRQPAKRKPRVSTRDAPLTGNIDFFLEYHTELSKPSKSGKPLWERKEKIFDWMSNKWHLGWATGWATAGDMLNDNGYRGQTIRQENRIRNDDYDIPFFRDSQMNPDDPKEHRWNLIERMDGSEFRFLNDVTKCHEKALENGSIGSAEHLQERMAAFLRTCDFMDHVKAQIHAEFGSLSFNLQDVRSLARTNKEIGEDLKRVISGKLLEETTTSQKLGDFSFPRTLQAQAQEDPPTTSIDFLRDDGPKQNIFTWERTQSLRSKSDLAREKATRDELAQILEYTAESVNLVEPPMPTVKGKPEKRLPKKPQESDASEGEENAASSKASSDERDGGTGNASEDKEATETSGASSDEASGVTESSEEDASDAEDEDEMETLLTGPIPGCDTTKIPPHTMKLLTQSVPEIGILEGLWLTSQGADADIANLRVNFDAPLRDPVSKKDHNWCIGNYNRGYRILTQYMRNKEKVQRGLHKPQSKKTPQGQPTSSSLSQSTAVPPETSLVNPLRHKRPQPDPQKFRKSRPATPPLSQSTPVPAKLPFAKSTRSSAQIGPKKPSSKGKERRPASPSPSSSQKPPTALSADNSDLMMQILEAVQAQGKRLEKLEREKRK